MRSWSRELLIRRLLFCPCKLDSMVFVQSYRTISILEMTKVNRHSLKSPSYALLAGYIWPGGSGRGAQGEQEPHWLQTQVAAYMRLGGSPQGGGALECSVEEQDLGKPRKQRVSRKDIRSNKWSGKCHQEPHQNGCGQQTCQVHGTEACRQLC